MSLVCYIIGYSPRVPLILCKQLYSQANWQFQESSSLREKSEFQISVKNQNIFMILNRSSQSCDKIMTPAPTKKSAVRLPSPVFYTDT